MTRCGGFITKRKCRARTVTGEDRLVPFLPSLGGDTAVHGGPLSGERVPFLVRTTRLTRHLPALLRWPPYLGRPCGQTDGWTRSPASGRTGWGPAGASSRPGERGSHGSRWRG